MAAVNSAAFVLLLIVAFASADHEQDNMAEFRAAHLKWLKAMARSSGYIMKSAVGSHFFSRNESIHHRLCQEHETPGQPQHLFGEDEASRTPKYLRQPNLLGKDEASRTPKHLRQPNLLGKDKASRTPKHLRQPNLLGKDKASRAPKNHISPSSDRHRRDLAPKALEPVPTHSVLSAFGLIRQLLKWKDCALNVTYDKEHGNPTRLTIIHCLGVVNKPVTLSQIKIVSLNSKVQLCGSSKPFRSPSAPLRKHMMLLKTGYHPFFRADDSSKAAGEWKEMKTGVNPAVFGAQVTKTGPPSGHHKKRGPKVHGFVRFFKSKTSALCRYLKMHRWIVPTTFAVGLTLTAVLVILVIRYRRALRHHAQSEDQHVLLVEDTKKVPVDCDQPASFYINENCA